MKGIRLNALAKFLFALHLKTQLAPAFRYNNISNHPITTLNNRTHIEFSFVHFANHFKLQLEFSAENAIINIVYHNYFTGGSSF